MVSQSNSSKGIDVDTSNTVIIGKLLHTYSSRVVKFIVIHYTGNTKGYCRKQMQHIFIMVHESASAHYFVDENSCYQSVALNNAAWAVGGTKVYKHAECRNINSISIEICCRW